MIYITIPVYNRKEILRNCLNSLKNQTCLDFKIIITDDGSTDGTGEMLEKEFPEVIVIKGDGSLYWTGGINKAIERALDICDENDDILLLNDDLVVPDFYIERFYQIAKKYPNSLVGSIVTDINERDRIDRGSVKINWITAKNTFLHKGKKLSDFPKGHVEETSYLTGRGVLIPSEVFRKIGLYNSKHYVQCGDTELPVRAKKAGYSLIVSYDVPVYSHTSNEGHINHFAKFSLKDIERFYFDKKSHTYIKTRFWFAMDSTKNVFHGLWYFTADFIRTSVHFVRRMKPKSYHPST